MFKENVKKTVNYLREHRRELAQILGNIEWLELTKGRIVIDETTLNQKYLPLFIKQLPSEVEKLDIRIRDGYFEVTADVEVKEEKVTGHYKIWIDQCVFHPGQHRFVLSYREEIPLDDVSLGKRLLFGTGKFLLEAITGQSVIGYVLRDTEGITFEGKRMILDLDQVPRFQQLQQKKWFGKSLLELVRIKNITLLDRRMNVDISIIGWDEPSLNVYEEQESRVEIETSQHEKIRGKVVTSDDQTIRLEEEHQRFYDRLRERIRIFIQEKGGKRAEKNAGYLLLVPDIFVLLARLLKDPRVPLKSKAIVGAAVAYFITPVDVIPEFLLGPLGFLDDLVLGVMALKAILVDVDPQIIEEHWNGEQSVLKVIRDVIERADDLVGSRTVDLLKKVLKLKK